MAGMFSAQYLAMFNGLYIARLLVTFEHGFRFV